METSKQKKVYVGLSGGVDSSVAAALLSQAKPNNFEKLFGRPTPEGFRGFDVTGVFIKVWDPLDYAANNPHLQDKLQKVCTWREDRRDAMRVAAQLGIPFKTVDLSTEYKQGVVDYMIAEYKAGRTPNPDVMCNKTIKFGAFFDWAIKEGADYVATGHYAQINQSARQSPGQSPAVFADGNGAGFLEEEAAPPLHTTLLLTPVAERAGHSRHPIKKTGDGYELLAGADPAKDQTYFLWTLTQKHLEHTLFPVGKFQKTEVRDLARQFKLPTAEKKDSQGLCFIGKLNVKEFLKEFIKEIPGEVINEKGEIIGHHEGSFFYTLGERRGFVITAKTPTDKPYYIIGKDLARNHLIISSNKRAGLKKEKVIKLDQINWNTGQGPDQDKIYQIRTRYRQPLEDCRLICTKGQWQAVIDNQNEEATPGQSLVVYEKTKTDKPDLICLGGGIIS